MRRLERSHIVHGLLARTGQLAIDLGGLHTRTQRSLAVDDAAATPGLTIGGIYEIALFHAERHSTGSNLKLTQIWRRDVHVTVGKTGSDSAHVRSICAPQPQGSRRLGRRALLDMMATASTPEQTSAASSLIALFAQLYASDTQIFGERGRT